MSSKGHSTFPGAPISLSYNVYGYGDAFDASGVTDDQYQLRAPRLRSTSTRVLNSWSCCILMAIDKNWVEGSEPGPGLRPTEPARSILASHFVPRLASQGREAHSLSRETFSQLRQELLGESYSQSRVEDGITDINKLICIVLKAGLEAAPSGVASEDDLEGQVFDCLEIIQACSEKAPQVLWDISDPLILGEDVQAPLFAWLILRLIKVASIWHTETIQDKVLWCLTSIAGSQYKQVRSSSSQYGIATFVCVCLSGPFILLSSQVSIGLILGRHTMLAGDV